jgi:hypothetical protein
MKTNAHRLNRAGAMPNAASKSARPDSPSRQGAGLLAALRKSRLSHLCSSVFICGSFLASASYAQGLSAFNDDALLVDLARRNQTALLERAFELANTPADRRDAIRATADLARLKTDARRMPVDDRVAMTTRVVNGLNATLEATSDPIRLAEQADALLASSVAIDVNTLEYWGPSLATQAQLKPVVETVIRLLIRVEQLSFERAGQIAERANPGDAAQMKRLEEAERLGEIAQQTRALAGYYLALCYEPTDPKRSETAAASIAFLEGFDVDGNPARANLKIVLGKLHAVRGDFDKARAQLDAAVALTDTGEARVGEAHAGEAGAFEARYFRAVVEVLGRDVEAARRQYDALSTWLKANPPADPSSEAAIRTANALLEYRITALEPGEPARTRANKLLIDLVQKRPDLEAPIMAQLRAGIGPQTPVASLEPLLLRALASDAQEQVIRAQSDAQFKPEPATVQRGLDAAIELAGRPNVDRRLAIDAMFLVPVFLETLGQRAEAAAKYVDFAQANKDAPESARAALTNAQRLFAQLGGLKSEDPAVTSLYDRIVPLALSSPFDQKELAFDWGVRLQQQGKWVEAAEWFERVGRSDGRHSAAQYLRMVALAQSLETPGLSQEAEMKRAAEIQKIAESVRKQAQIDVSAALNEASRRVLKQRLARTALLAASLAREGGEPGRALAFLEGIESHAEGLADAEAILGEAMFTRVQSNILLGRSDAAVAELVKLLDQSGGSRGAQIIFNLLAKLETDFNSASVKGDRDEMGRLQEQRALLTPYLVKWAKNNVSPEVKKFAYTYAVYDAETQRIAAELLNDPAAKARRREEARALYEALDSIEGRKAFVAAQDGSKGPLKLPYDPQVALGLARISYDAGEWTKARDAYAKLLSDRVLGTAMAIRRDPGGAEQQVDNDVYWEATFRLFDTKVKAGDDLEPIKMLLREQDVRWGERVGGTKWKDSFQTLRKSLIPDFQP